MKKLHLFFVAFAISLLVACGGGTPSYDAAKCEQLKVKVDNKEDLTEDDYNTMVDQMVVIAKDLKAVSDQYKDDKEKQKELRKDEEFKKKAEYCIGFALYISMHQKDLPASTLKKMIDAKDDMEALKDM